MAFHLRQAVLGALAPHREREQHKGLVKQSPAPARGLWAVPSGAHRELLHTGVSQCFLSGNRAGRWFWCPIPGSPSALLRDSTQCWKPHSSFLSSHGCSPSPLGNSGTQSFEDKVHPKKHPGDLLLGLNQLPSPRSLIVNLKFKQCLVRN